MEVLLTRKNASAPAAFLEKLYDILEDTSLESYISWQPDGQSFLIRDVNSVSELVLPHYFKHNNIQSFVRQLNMYSFTKTRHDSNYREFRQPLFQRGRRDLLSIIKRKTQGSTDKNSALRRKLGNREIEIELKCITSTTDEESEDKLSCDGADDDISEEVSSSSSCSSDNEVPNRSSCRNQELEEIKCCMNNLESQMLSLNERYGILSASYGTLREKFENYQNNHTSPQLSSLIKMPETQLRDVPKHLISLDNRPLVRMMNSLSQRFVQKGESINACERKLWIGQSDDSETQERKKRKPSVSEVLGLQAMAAAAASLYNDDAVPQVELSLPRSSLADLLYAANFNSCESNQSSTRMMTALT